VFERDTQIEEVGPPIRDCPDFSVMRMLACLRPVSTLSLSASWLKSRKMAQSVRPLLQYPSDSRRHRRPQRYR